MQQRQYSDNELFASGKAFTEAIKVSVEDAILSRACQISLACGRFWAELAERPLAWLIRL
ncbi:hypothetical protein ULE26_21365 (plasmid) [Stutzerimonas stutzeri]|nr:hypothetical protein ULE26_21365 [Stutzerimonas stutzeri]